MIITLVLLLAGEETYHLGHATKFTNITFENHGEIESIVGMTNEVRGTIVVDREKRGGSVSITVPVKSLRTGIAMRDEHLLGRMWFEADKHPDITFVSKRVTPHEKMPNAVNVTGEFTMHGVTREVAVVVEYRDIPEEVTKRNKFADGKWIRFTASFEVKFSDYGIKGADAAKEKIADVTTVKMVLFAGTAKPEK